MVQKWCKSEVISPKSHCSSKGIPFVFIYCHVNGIQIHMAVALVADCKELAGRRTDSTVGMGYCDSVFVVLGALIKAVLLHIHQLVNRSVRLHPEQIDGRIHPTGNRNIVSVFVLFNICDAGGPGV